MDPSPDPSRSIADHGRNPADQTDTLTTEGHLGVDFLVLVGRRIRALRRARGLTMQQLADRASISRRLLGQIEHGQANPSLVAITRLARQLGTDFTTLLDEAAGVDDTPVEVLPRDGHPLVWSSDAGSTAHLLIATTPTRTADLWRWRLVPGDRYEGHADPERSQELFYVLSGTLTLRVDGSEVTVPAGYSSRLRSDRPYSYLNEGSDPTEFLRIVSLAQ